MFRLGESAARILVLDVDSLGVTAINENKSKTKVPFHTKYSCSGLGSCLPNREYQMLMSVSQIRRR